MSHLPFATCGILDFSILGQNGSLEIIAMAGERAHFIPPNCSISWRPPPDSEDRANGSVLLLSVFIVPLGLFGGRDQSMGRSFALRTLERQTHGKSPSLTFAVRSKQRDTIRGPESYRLCQVSFWASWHPQGKAMASTIFKILLRNY